MKANNQWQREGSVKGSLAIALLALLVVGSLYALDVHKTKPSVAQGISTKPKVKKTLEKSACEIGRKLITDKQWHEKLAELTAQKEGRALYLAAILYRDLNCPLQNDEKALTLLKEAGELGCGQASYQLGSIYELGRYGATKDLAASLAYYQEAERQKVSGARYAVKRLQQWIYIASQKANASSQGTLMSAAK